MHTLLFLFLWLSSSCQMKNDKLNDLASLDLKESVIVTEAPIGNTIASRFPPPEGYVRTSVPENSYAYYLRSLPLKNEGAKVQYFNGKEKMVDHVYEAVVDLDIGTKDLHQCADAIIRLRAEYLWESKLYDEIHFNFTNGFEVAYRNWLDGDVMNMEGNKTFWTKGTARSSDYDDFWQYLELIFNYAGTHSLSKELTSVPFHEMEIGDVMIQGGFPGHAVIVVDMVMEEGSDKKKYLLAQSYMPAQDLQILKNNQTDHNSWYALDDAAQIYTPEWTFNRTDLKRFK